MDRMIELYELSAVELRFYLFLEVIQSGNSIPSIRPGFWARVHSRWMPCDQQSGNSVGNDKRFICGGRKVDQSV